MIDNIAAFMGAMKEKTNVKLFKTMHESLDILLDGGIPQGRITEIHGETDIGKTKMIFDIIKNNKNSNKLIAYIATSRKSLHYIKARNLDNHEQLIVLISNKEEEIIDFIKSSVKIVDLFVIDSIAEVLTKNEQNNMDMNENQEMPRLLNTINTILYGEEAALIAVNHVMFKNNQIVPKWDIAFKQYCTVRINMQDECSLHLILHKIKPDIVERIR